MESVGVALEFAIGFLPAFPKAISPMTFAIFVRIGSPGEHENSTVQPGNSVVQGEVGWPGIFDNDTPTPR